MASSGIFFFFLTKSKRTGSTAGPLPCIVLQLKSRLFGGVAKNVFTLISCVVIVEHINYCLLGEGLVFSIQLSNKKIYIFTLKGFPHNT